MWFSVFFIGFLVALLVAVYLYFELRNSKEKYSKEHKENEQKLFELAILSEVSEKIGYSLSSKDIASTIASTCEKLFQVSAVSYGIIETDHVEVTTITYENVGPHYIGGVKDIVLQGIYNIDDAFEKLPVTHFTKAKHIDTQEALLIDSLMQYDAQPLSYFNIPLVLNNRFTGIINITSKFPHAYQEEDMSMLYKIVNRAQLAIGRLEKVIDTEKGKVDSLVKSLSSGEIFFTLEKGALHLYTINSAAKRFLHLNSDNPDLIHVLASFNLKPNIIKEMKDVIIQKKSTIYRDVGIGQLKFNIYLSPVFSADWERVIGVALTMQDVTREHETQRIREGFTNMMIHELRAPLTAIKGAAELLMQPTTEEEDRTKMRLIIKNASERLLHDIDDMLDSAKIDAGKMMVEKIDGNINDVIEKTAQELSYAASSRAILIENHLDHQIPYFAFDPVRIGQVVANLLSNSIKYSDSHTIIEIFSRIEHDMVEIEVRDHGSGIEKEKISLLFQPFSQVNFFKRMKGSGLGLF
ncbi:MAG: GAF domain-containing sensor histidine kinase, partial [Candidatus Levybacteria bacterium]|nr:GAF domain-containing sensor histidine kinase [Candidatus Levybacteria bacterium]